MKPLFPLQYKGYSIVIKTIFTINLIYAQLHIGMYSIHIGVFYTFCGVFYTCFRLSI